MRRVPHQITFIAFTTNEDGTRSVYDIVETSYRYAHLFARGYMRNKEVSSFKVCRPHEHTVGREWKRC